MEDLQPIYVTEQAAFCVELTKRLNMQRKQDHLCDVTLVTKDEKEFKAHRNVLSAASPFFHKLLQSDMKENRDGIVRFEEISGSVMEDVLQFIYTGSVEITQENSEDLVATANYLLIPGLKTVSGRFLEGQISQSNCISTFYFAEKYQCDELLANTRKFIHANFVSVAEMDEFLNLEAKEVERWISSDEISVAVEADVFQIILKWFEHNKSERKATFEELFRHVRLVFLSRDYLLDVVTNELVRENSGCYRLTSDAIKLTTFASEDDDLPQLPRKGLETRAIVACGGKYTFCYLPEKDEWKRLPDGLSEKNQKTQTMKFRDQLYTFPQYGKAERYDPVFNGWATLDLSTNSAMVAVVRGEIYAIEVEIEDDTSTIKRYSVELCSWQTVLSSHEGCREEACVVAAGNCFYVLGGKPSQESKYVTKAERFDTVENKWEEIADMQQERGEAFGVATQGKIFVAGGRHSVGLWAMWLTTCEMYNVSTNEWQFIGSLNGGRLYGSMVCLNKKLYVLGGTRDSQSGLSVECYDHTEDKWIDVTTIPVKVISNQSEDTFTCCVLKLSKGVLDKLWIVEEDDMGFGLFD
ncbi:kelch-like protein 24 [Oculina patagonica]